MPTQAQLETLANTVAAGDAALQAQLTTIGAQLTTDENETLQAFNDLKLDLGNEVDPTNAMATLETALTNQAGVGSGLTALGSKLVADSATIISADPGGVATSLVFSVPAGIVAGVPVVVTVTATDANGRVATGHGTLTTVTSSDTGAVISGAAMVGGIAKYTITFSVAGSPTITATDGTLTSTALNVSVAAAGS